MRKHYIKPEIEIIEIKTDFNILAGSPPTVPVDPTLTTDEQW